MYKENCILCKIKPKEVKTCWNGSQEVKYFCEECKNEDFFKRLAAFQRHIWFYDAFKEYQDECWRVEDKLKTDEELYNYLRKNCSTFSPEHLGFKEMQEEVKELNKEIDKVIESKQKCRNVLKARVEKLRADLKYLKRNIGKVELERIDKVRAEIQEKEIELAKKQKDLIKVS